MTKKPKTLDLKIVRARIQDRMSALVTTANATSLRAGLGATAVHDILSGKNRKPSALTLFSIAKALETTLGYLVGEEEFPTVRATELEAAPIPIVGIAETGAFRVMSETSPECESELPQIFAPKSKLYPNARHFALEVRGDSMNAAKPTPIVEGMFVCCVDVIDADLPIESGRIYAVRRTLDGGQTWECTIKRAKVFKDRVELWPESTNQRHKPLILTNRSDADPSTEIAAIGLVYATFNSLEML